MRKNKHPMHKKISKKKMRTQKAGTSRTSKTFNHASAGPDWHAQCPRRSGSAQNDAAHTLAAENQF